MDNATTLTAPNASPPPNCLPDCATDHTAEGPLDGQLCTSPPVAIEARNGEHLLVWAGRFTDDSAAETSVSIAHAPDGALPAELSPDRARHLAAELVRAAELAEQSTAPQSGVGLGDLTGVPLVTANGHGPDGSQR